MAKMMRVLSVLFIAMAATGSLGGTGKRTLVEFGTRAMMGCPRNLPIKSSAHLSDPLTLPSIQDDNQAP